MQAEHHTTDHEQKTAHGAMDGWICRPMVGPTLSLYGEVHMLSCVCKSARARVYVW